MSRADQRLHQTSALLRLAGLRRDLRRRDLASAQADHAARAEALAQARAFYDELRREQAERAQALREPMLGNAQLRGALAAVLDTFVADRQREAEAEAALEAAAADLAAAHDRLEAARRDLLLAERKVTQRRNLHEPLVAARALRREKADEAEAEDRNQQRRA